MATEEQKKQNVLRLVNMALLSLTAGVWNTLGESAFALSNPMGEAILNMMEKEMGLEIAGESPQAVMTEISRIFVDEFGFAGDIAIESQDGNRFQMKVKNCINTKFTDKLLAAGVEKPFICPILNSCAAALNRMNFKMHGTVDKWADGNGSIITFTGI